MNVIIGDSRVAGLKYLHPLKLIFEDIWSKPGCSITQCTSLVEDNLIFHHPPLTNLKTHFYIFAGICDLTTMLRAKNYQEVVFYGHPTTVEDCMSVIDATSDEIVKLGAVPIFCTIPPLHLLTWNTLRLEQGKTSVLKHKEKYPEMQSSLESAVQVVNSLIVQKNAERHLATPTLHTCMARSKNKKIYHLYKMLPDGCHPGEEMTHKMVSSFQRAVSLNSDQH